MPLRAQAMKGIELLHLRNGGEYGKLLFTYYTAGFVEAYNLSSALTVIDWKVENKKNLPGTAVKPPRLRVCFSEGQTNEQVRLVIIKYLKDNPKELHKDATVLMAKAVEQVFPCK